MSLEDIKKFNIKSSIIQDLNKIGLDGDKIIEAWEYLLKQAEKTQKYEETLKEISTLNECDPAYRIALFAGRVLKENNMRD